MLVGVNYPWIDYGWDFGDPPPGWVPAAALPAWRAAKRSRIEEDFGFFASLGIRAVRWFLLADGLSYGTGDLAPRRAGGTWTFDPLPDGHPFHAGLRDDFEFVLDACSRSGLELLPSLIDFHWCRHGVPAAGGPGIVKCGRRDIVRDPAKRRAFFDRVLEPLLESSLRHRDSIYAWELINEPEWAVRRGSIFRLPGRDGNVSLAEMREFITEGIRRINARRLPDGSGAFPSSVGFAHRDSLDGWGAADLGMTLHQFHYYALRHRDLPGHADLGHHPCVVGEFATAASRAWPGLKRLKRDQSVASRLRCIEDRGYPACFMWSARAVDPATRWTAEEHRQVIGYTRPGTISPAGSPVSQQVPNP